jgi:hypothetical protein
MQSNTIFNQANNISEYIDATNRNLTQLFGAKHIPITFADLNLRKSDKLLGVQNAKTIKGLSLNILTGILYLAPASLVGFNVCPFASDGCKQACLFSAGRGRFYNVTRSRAIKTLKLIASPEEFMFKLSEEISKLTIKARKANMQLAIRLNGTSDIDWKIFNYKDDMEHIHIFERHRYIQFYDYTKDIRKAITNNINNYYLTFSKSEINTNLLSKLPKHINIAVVFNSAHGAFPAIYLGRKVINGDLHDVRFLDEQGVIVGLSAKGKAKKDTSGFVVQCGQSVERKAS